MQNFEDYLGKTCIKSVEVPLDVIIDWRDGLKSVLAVGAVVSR